MGLLHNMRIDAGKGGKIGPRWKKKYTIEFFSPRRMEEMGGKTAGDSEQNADQKAIKKNWSQGQKEGLPFVERGGSQRTYF